jgi:hypothetical protein
MRDVSVAGRSLLTIPVENSYRTPGFPPIAATESASHNLRQRYS